jgi:hypothetical protein
MQYSDFDKIITENRIAEFEKKFVIDMLEDVIYNKKYGKYETQRFTIGRYYADGDKDVKKIIDYDIDNIRKHIDKIFKHLELKEPRRLRNNTNVKDNIAFKKENIYDIALLKEQKYINQELLSLYPAAGYLPEDAGEIWEDDRFYYRSEDDMVLVDETLISILPMELQRHIPKRNKISLIEMYFISVLAKATMEYNVTFLADSKRNETVVNKWMDMINREIGQRERLLILNKHVMKSCIDYIDYKIESEMMRERREDEIERYEAIKYTLLPAIQLLITEHLPADLINITFYEGISGKPIIDVVGYLNQETCQEKLHNIAKQFIEDEKAKVSKRNHNDNKIKKEYKKNRLKAIIKKENEYIQLSKDYNYFDGYALILYYVHYKVMIEKMQSSISNILKAFPEVEKLST